jgi:hypothetical protein
MLVFRADRVEGLFCQDADFIVFKGADEGGVGDEFRGVAQWDQ